MTQSLEDNQVSIAVMPFKNRSSESDTEFFADGFVEDLTANLTRFPSLRVLASQSAFGLSRSDKSIYEVAKEWKVDYVLEGSIRRSGSTIRAGVQLVRSIGQDTLWAEKFDASLEKVFDVLDEITSTVAGKLAIQIDATRLSTAKRESIENIPAYDCCLRGMDCLRRGTLEGDEESRPFFQYALQIDPRFARAYSGLSLSHFNEWTCNAWHLWDESEANAYDFASKAVELDGSDAMAHSVLARVSRFRHEHAQADQHGARALSLNPNDSYVLIQVAISELFGGTADHGLRLAEKAIQLNPLHGNWYLGIFGWCLFMLKRYEEASEFLLNARESIVNFAAYRSACAAIAGDLDRAKQEFDTFEKEYCNKIAFGREPQPGEALRWAVQVEPFRRIEDSSHMPRILRDAGIVEIDVPAAISNRKERMVRPADVVRPTGNVFVRDGKIWSISYEGNGASLVELKGFHDIARLLAQPNESIHSIELSGVAANSDSGYEMLDSQARREYRQRIEELQIDLEKANDDNDAARADRVRKELDSIIDELAKATGLGGRSRKVGDSAERARTAVTWRIRSAIKKIAAAHPRLGQHLSNSIRTGNFCEYSPEIPMEWEL